MSESIFQGDVAPIILTGATLPGQAVQNQLFIKKGANAGLYYANAGSFVQIPDVNGTIANATTAVNATQLGTIAATQFPNWFKYAVDVASTNLVVSQGGVALSTTALAAASTQSLTIVQLPANAYVHGLRIKTRTVFAGPAALTCTVGVTSALTKFISSAFNLFTTVSATQLADAVAFGNTSTAAINLIVAFTVTTTNMTDITSGAFDLWVDYSVLP
jgi:hypothetical protein